MVLVLDSKSCMVQHAKRDKVKFIFLTISKTCFFTNDTKHRHIIYRWKVFFATIKNLKSLTQNKAPFDSIQLSKSCHFAWKSVQIIWALSL